MNKRNFLSKAVAWLLIALMANPAAIAPAFARDTDIFLNTTSGATTAEPNIMVVLDTSDSMNYFEDWHEYPGAYDSHIEYLWNDAIIGLGGAPQNAESASFIASGVGPTVSGIARAGTTATVTYTSAHGYAVGWTVNVYNATDPLYNGAFTIASVPSGTTLTYTMSGTPAAPAVAVGGHVLYASSRSPAPSSVYGFWGGATNAPEDRLATWAAAKAYANATNPGDPGVRTTYRDYNDGSWIYWLPANTATTDLRLSSQTWNRWQGHIKTIGGTRGGVAFGATTDYRSYNRCNDSGNDPTLPANPSASGQSSTVDPVDGVTPQGLTASTIFAPTSAPRNSGRYLNQQWVRWERFLNLKNNPFQGVGYTYSNAFSGVNVNGGVAAVISAGSGTGNVGASITARNDYAINMSAGSATGAARDSLPNAPGYGNGTTNIGSQGLPIRNRRDDNAPTVVDSVNDSRSGWTSLKADLGGSVLFGTINGMAGAVLTQVKSWYGLPSSPNVYEAYKGNRDSNPEFSTSAGTFDMTTGVPAYYDTPGAIGAIAMAAPTTVTVAEGTNGFVVGNVINIEGANSGANLVTTITAIPANNTITINPGAVLAADLNWAPISMNLRLTTGVAPNECVRTCTLQGPPLTAALTIADVKNNDAGNNPRFYATSAMQCLDSTGVLGNTTAGGTSNIVGGGCAAFPVNSFCGAGGVAGAVNNAGSVYQTANYAGCTWSGRSSLYVEGQGTYYYGGTCGAAATCTPGAGGATNCVAASNVVSVYGTVAGVNVSKSNYCTVTAAPTVQNLSISGTAMPGAVLNAGANGSTGAAQGCAPLANVAQACPARPGAPGNPAGCIYVNGASQAASTTNACSNIVSTGTFSTTDYAVFNFVTSDNNLVHDCIADNGTIGNPTSGYAKNNNNANSNAPFNTAWSASYNSTALGTTAPYSTAGRAISGPSVDSYSVNYLNWMFGPKGPNNAPIGRKTRLQIAKDALTSIVASTNGVRFGLMQFNKTSACNASTGTINPDSNTFVVGSNPGFTVGQSIVVNGAGPSGANLNAVVTAVSGNNITFGAAAASPTTTGNTSSPTTANTNSLTTGATNGVTTGTVSAVVGLNKVTVANVAGYQVGHLITVNGLARTVSAIAGSVITFTGGNAVAGGPYPVLITGVGASTGVTALTNVSNIAGYVAGQYITITGAGAGGTDLVDAKISSIAGTTINLTSPTYIQTPAASNAVRITVPTAAGVTALTNVAGIAGYAVGQTIQVLGGGAYGGNLTTTISAINVGTGTMTLAAGAGTAALNLPVQITSPVAAGSAVALTSVGNITGFAVGQTISVSGAGPGGSDLVTTINAIVGSTITMATGASLAVTGATVKVVAAAPQTTASDPSYWLTVAAIGTLIVGNNIKVTGAGAGGADLLTSITAINGTNVMMAAPAQTAVVGAAVQRAAIGSLAVYNTTGTTQVFSSGGNQLVVSSTAGFVAGQSININGAGPGGTTLNATINAIAGNTLTLSNPISTAVLNSGVSIASYTTSMATNPCSGTVADDGANVARVIKRMGSNSSDLPDYNNRATLNSAINALTASSRTPLTESMYEAYRYFSGRAPVWGTVTATATSGGSVTAGRDPAAICTSSGGTSGCTAIGNYASPMLNNPNTTSPAGCQKNFLILITDGGPEDDYSANGDVKSLSWTGPLGVVAPRTGLDSTQPDTATNQFEIAAGVPYGPTDLSGTSFDGGYIWLDELTYFMGNADVSPGAHNFPSDSGADSITGRQSINTYTIGFAGANTPVLQNAALRGNGVAYTADNSAGLAAAIIAALAAITNWNPTISSPTVPISALNRAQNATDVYLAFFAPAPTSEWVGTVKRYELSQYPNNGDPSICGAGIGLCLIGQTQLTKSAPNPSPTWNIETVVVDVITGISQSQVDTNAVSFWGPTTLKDGSQPNQGGTGYQLISNTATMTPDTRNVYTFLTSAVAQQNGNSGNSILLTNAANKVHFNNATAISKCRLGDAAACGGAATMTDATQETLINWLRGGDVGGASTSCIDGLSTACTTWRGWAHGDVQHSTPAVVTYQITPSVTQYMYYLANNGLLTAVDTSTGKEQWSFMVEEALPQVQAMLTNNAGAEIYVADGAPTIYVNDINGDGNINGSDKVWLFFGLRRGGRVYYALDITQPNAPVFGWKIDASTTPAKVCVANGACTNAPQFNELGQSWSTPFIGKVRANANPVMIVGGGYDPVDDCQPVVTGPGPTGCTPGARSMGRAVYVIDAFSANLVQSWGVGQGGPFLGGGSGSMIYAIPSAVTALNTDLDAQGFLDRLYVGDTWGNVWRMDIDDASVTNWKAKLLATLSSDIASGERRKILFPPAAVKQNAPYRFDAVYVGTGDIEHPLCLTSNQVVPTVMTNTCATFAPADAMFMMVDPDYGLTASNTAPILVSDLYQRPTTDITTNTSNTILNTYKGWYRGLDDGEKVSNAATVFSEQLRFGTYAPLGQSGGACVPPGEGRLNQIDAITGDLVPINGSVSSSSDRYYSTFITHGYISTGQLIVEGKNIYHIVVSDSRLQSVLVGSMGSATKVYWYIEPEQ